MIPVLYVAALAFFAFFLIGKLVRRSRIQVADATRPDPLELFVKDQLVLIIGDKLDLDDEALSTTLRFAPDAEIVSAIEKEVRRVELVFEKRPGAGPARVDLGVEVLFEDGKLDRRLSEVTWSWVPKSVEEQLARSGAARAHQAWLFPWQRDR